MWFRFELVCSFWIASTLVTIAIKDYSIRITGMRHALFATE